MWEALKRGWQVCQPFTHAQPYDFVARFNPRELWRTIQVKTAYVENKDAKSRYRVNLRRNRAHPKYEKAYEEFDFDFLFVVIPAGPCYLIPYEKVAHIKRNLILQPSHERYRLAELRPKESQSTALDCEDEEQ